MFAIVNLWTAYFFVGILTLLHQASKLFLMIRYSNKFVFPLLYLSENSLDLPFDQVERLSLFQSEFYTKRNGIRIK